MTTQTQGFPDSEGFAIIPRFISADAADELSRAIECASGDGIIRRGQVIFGIRNLLRVVPETRALAQSPQMRALVESALNREAKPVRGIFFDKTPQTNWGVAWHQDLTIPLQEKIEVEDFGPWSVKAGVWHALAPASVLERMLTVRIHLDDAEAHNGALRVMPGSHLHGRLSDEQIEQWECTGSPVTCAVKKGDALLMRPLLLHSSYSAVNPDHRRVIHLEFATGRLPGGLNWHTP